MQQAIDAPDVALFDAHFGQLAVHARLSGVEGSAAVLWARARTALRSLHGALIGLLCLACSACATRPLPCRDDGLVPPTPARSELPLELAELDALLYRGETESAWARCAETIASWQSERDAALPTAEPLGPERAERARSFFATRVFGPRPVWQLWRQRLVLRGEIVQLCAVAALRGGGASVLADWFPALAASDPLLQALLAFASGDAEGAQAWLARDDGCTETPMGWRRQSRAALTAKLPGSKTEAPARALSPASDADAPTP